MKVKTKNINDYCKEINVDIPWSEIESDFEISLRKFSKKVKMPGFRSGKIPRDRLLGQFEANIEAEFLDSNFPVAAFCLRLPPHSTGHAESK